MMATAMGSKVAQRCSSIHKEMINYCATMGSASLSAELLLGSTIFAGQSFLWHRVGMAITCITRPQSLQDDVQMS